MFAGKKLRPPSSYGSMKSDSDGEEGTEQELSPSVFTEAPPSATIPKDMGLQKIRCESPETLDTISTQQTKPLGGLIIDTRALGLGDFEEEGDEQMVEDLVTRSPEPQEPVETEISVQPEENSQVDILHPEQDLPHIFKSIQEVLSGLTMNDMCSFKMCLLKKDKSLLQANEGDILDFVDKMLEVFGPDNSLLYTINTLHNIKKKMEAEKLHNLCERALTRFHLKQQLIIKHRVIREGVPRPGKQNYLNTIYVAPQITQGYDSVDPSHEIQAHFPSPFQVPSADTSVDLNNLFRLKKNDGQTVRTVITTGIPGIGLTVSVGKYCLDWAELCANKDLQFIIKLSFHDLWCLRNSHPQNMSIMEVIQYYHPGCKGMKYLEEEDCRFLIIMDSFDCYLAPLDWENIPVISDISTPAPLDVLIVNILRGSVLRDGCVWVLGRRAAVSQIPSQFIDVVTEIQGFSDEKKDEYLTKRFSNAELSTKIAAHYKRLPTLNILAWQPIVCWMIATVFEFCFQSEDYGVHPPRLTPFYVNILIIHTNRSVELYKKAENDKIWSDEIRLKLTKMGKLAFNMLQRNSNMFFEEDMMECGLNVMEVAVFSGLCTELSTSSSRERRKFCYIHFTFQEFMAALYVFTVFRSESKNVLDSGSLLMLQNFIPRDQSKLAPSLVLSAVELTLGAPLGQYDMFLRFLCGLLSPDCHGKQLSGFLFPHGAAQISGLNEVQQLLEKTINAQQNNTDRVENLKECLREMTQVHD